MSQVIVGNDNRIPPSNSPTSIELARAFCEGLSTTGCNVTYIGTVPTPLVYYGLVSLEQDASVMITGSHNPREYNGIKFTLGKQDKFPLNSISVTELNTIKDIIKNNEFSTRTNGSLLMEKRSPDSLMEHYIEDMGKIIKPFRRPVRVVLDAGNATASIVAPVFLETIGCTVECMYCDLDGTFPNHTPNPERPSNMKALARKVVDKSADIGFGYDGDADRVGIIDNTGSIIFPDEILALLSQDILKEYSNAAVVYDTLCSETLAITIREHGGRPVRSPTGYTIIRKRMFEENAILGGEISGHLFFRDRGLAGYDDGVYASARIAELVGQDDRPLSKRIAELPRWFQMRQKRLQISEQEKMHVIDKLKNNMSALALDFVESDGITTFFRDDEQINGRAVVRLSSTEPVLSVICEATSEEKRNKIEHLLNEILTKAIGRTLPDW